MGRIKNWKYEGDYPAEFGGKVGEWWNVKTGVGVVLRITPVPCNVVSNYEIDGDDYVRYLSQMDEFMITPFGSGLCYYVELFRGLYDKKSFRRLYFTDRADDALRFARDWMRRHPIVHKE